MGEGGLNFGQLLAGVGGGVTPAGVDPNGALLQNMIAKLQDPAILDQLAMQAAPPPAMGGPQQATAEVAQLQAQPQGPTAPTPMPAPTPAPYPPGQQAPAPVETGTPVSGTNPAQPSLGQMLGSVGNVMGQQPQQPRAPAVGGGQAYGSAALAKPSAINTAPQGRLDPRIAALSLGQMLQGGR